MRNALRQARTLIARTGEIAVHLNLPRIVLLCALVFSGTSCTLYVLHNDELGRYRQQLPQPQSVLVSEEGAVAVVFVTSGEPMTLIAPCERRYDKARAPHNPVPPTAGLAATQAMQPQSSPFVLVDEWSPPNDLSHYVLIPAERLAEATERGQAAVEELVSISANLPPRPGGLSVDDTTASQDLPRRESLPEWFRPRLVADWTTLQVPGPVPELAHFVWPPQELKLADARAQVTLFAQVVRTSHRWWVPLAKAPLLVGAVALDIMAAPVVIPSVLIVAWQYEAHERATDTSASSRD